MTENTTQLRAALALVELVTQPELRILAWSVTPSGLLTGSANLREGDGAAVYACAHLMGGTVTHTQFTSTQGQPRITAQLLTNWRDVMVDVWVSYPQPQPQAVLMSPAEQLAAELRTAPGILSAHVAHENGVYVSVRPSSLAEWASWRERFAASGERFEGGTVTAAGAWGDVSVQLLGIDVAPMVRAAALSGGVI